MLVIAVAKGRLLESALEIFERAEIRFADDPLTSRKLIFDAVDGRHRIVLVKPADVATYVEYGAADAGIVGRDVLMEAEADLVQPLTFKFGYCRIATARLKDAGAGNGHTAIRVATKYPRIAMTHFNARGIPVEIIPLSGSIELAPLVGLADIIVDLVESGRTLKENGLEIAEVIAESSARFIVNRAAYQIKRSEIQSTIAALEKAEGRK